MLIRGYERIPTLASFEDCRYMSHIIRKQFSDEIGKLLIGRERRLHNLFNFLTIALDRLVDDQVKPPDYLLSMKNLMERVWQGEPVELKDEYEQVAMEFVENLRGLQEDGWILQGQYIYEEYSLHLGRDYENVMRRGKVLPEKELERINKGAIEAGFAAYFQLVAFHLSRKEAWQLMEKYGLPIMVGDDLTDIAEDIAAGFISVPEEDIKHLDMEHSHLDKGYGSKRIQELDVMFKEGDQILNSILPKLPVKEQKRTVLTRNLFYTWVDDAKRIYVPS